nr:PREDICTED: splicing regulatory glutamine/lysine-rich protein 1-like [Megachile rotundata]
MTIERNRSRTVSSLEKTIFKEKEGQQSNDREGISFVRENNGATADVVLVDLETPLLIVALLEFQVGSTKNERSNVGRDIRKEESTATRSSVTDQETKCTAFFSREKRKKKRKKGREGEGEREREREEEKRKRERNKREGKHLAKHHQRSLIAVKSSRENSRVPRESPLRGKNSRGDSPRVERPNEPLR